MLIPPTAAAPPNRFIPANPLRSFLGVTAGVAAGVTAGVPPSTTLAGLGAGKYRMTVHRWEREREKIVGGFVQWGEGGDGGGGRGKGKGSGSEVEVGVDVPQAGLGPPWCSPDSKSSPACSSSSSWNITPYLEDVEDHGNGNGNGKEKGNGGVV